MGTATLGAPKIAPAIGQDTVVLPKEIRLRVSRYVINKSIPGSISECPIARAAFFALRRSIGPNFNVEVWKPCGDDVLIDVFIDDEQAGNYRLFGGAKFVSDFDFGRGASAFDAVAHLE